MSKISEKVKSLDVKNQMEAVLKEQLDTLVSLTNHMTEQAENSIRESLRQGAATGGYEVPVTSSLAAISVRVASVSPGST